MIKKFMTAFGVVSVLVMSMMLAACPNNLDKTDTEQGQESSAPEISESDANSAASGISANVTLKGTIDGTECDIALDASTGTFEAVQSRSDVSFKGEFFYNNGKIFLKVNFKGDVPFGKNYSAETQLNAGTTVTLAEVNDSDYKTAKDAFEKAVKSSVDAMLKKIDNSLKNAKIKLQKTSDGVSVTVFEETFDVKISGITVQVGADVPSWFMVVYNYINSKMSDFSTMMPTDGPTLSPDMMKIGISAMFGGYANISKAVGDLFDVYLSGDNPNGTADLSADLAEIELKLKAGWNMTVNNGVVAITVGTESFSLDMNKHDLSALEGVPTWFIKLFQTLNIANIMEGSDANISDIQSMLTQKYGDYKKVCEFAADFFQKFILSMTGDLSDDVKAIIDVADTKLAAYIEFNFSIDAASADGQTGKTFKVDFVSDATSSDGTVTVTVTMSDKATVSNTEFQWLADFMSLFADIDVETLVKEMTDDTTVAETVPSDNTTGGNIPDADKKMAALMMYVSTKTSAVQFVRKWMTFIGSIMGTDVLAQYKPQLSAAEEVLGTFANSNMTAVMTSDGLQITIGGESNNKIEFTYSVAATAQSSDVPEWFVSLYPVISSLLNGTSGDNAATAAMDYLTQNYPGTAKLSQAIATAMQQMMSNTGN